MLKFKKRNVYFLAYMCYDKPGNEYEIRPVHRYQGPHNVTTVGKHEGK